MPNQLNVKSMPINPLPQTPALYSFRRCPYAMRARLMIYYSGETVEHRDILLKSKPTQMIEASPKATVPVLVLASGQVLEESRDIMQWAVDQNDPQHLLPSDQHLRNEIQALLDENDGSFKSALDQYKYHVRFPEKSREEYRAEGEKFLAKLEAFLNKTRFLMTDEPTMADIGIFPFIRQFANSDRTWFDNSPYPKLRQWLEFWTENDGFRHVMKKQTLWSPDADPIYYPNLSTEPKN